MRKTIQEQLLNYTSYIQNNERAEADEYECIVFNPISITTTE